MYNHLKQMDERPYPYQYYTAETLWNDPHISKKMLDFHLNPHVEPASRNITFINRSAEWMAERFRIGRGMQIADFGCGPGLYTTRYARLGASVTGVDFSERSIAYARKQAAKDGLDITYVCQNYLEFLWNHPFDLISLIYCDFCALSPEQRQTLLSVLYDHLDDGGRVVLDVFSMAAFDQRKDVITFSRRLMDGFWSDQDYYGFMKTIRYEDEKVVLDKYVIVESSRIWEVYNWLQYYTLESLAKDVASQGFHIEQVFSDVAGAPFSKDSDVIGVVLHK